MDGKEILWDVLLALIPILVALLGVLLNLARKYIAKMIARLDSEAARTALMTAWTDAERAALTAVDATQQTFVDGIKKGREDGKLTKEEQAAALAQARTTFTTLISKGALDVLNTMLHSAGDWVAALIEAKVGERSLMRSQVARIAAPLSVSATAPGTSAGASQPTAQPSG